MSIYKPTWLYIKQHNQTGLKYFGKTIRANPFTYNGSGKYWIAHLRKHGADVTTLWCHLYSDETTLVEEAISFSTSHTIVNDLNHNGKKIWANMILENGLGGSTKGINAGVKKSSLKSIRKISEKQIS